MRAAERFTMVLFAGRKIRALDRRRHCSDWRSGLPNGSENRIGGGGSRRVRSSFGQGFAPASLRLKSNLFPSIMKEFSFLEAW